MKVLSELAKNYGIDRIELDKIIRETEKKFGIVD